MTRDDLIAAQLHEFPDSRIVTDDEAAWWPMETTEVVVPRVEGKTEQYIAKMKTIMDLRSSQYSWLDFCFRTTRNNDFIRVFYECGWSEDEEKYRWRGCRYGVNPEDYISGYPR